MSLGFLKRAPPPPNLGPICHGAVPLGPSEHATPPPTHLQTWSSLVSLKGIFGGALKTGVIFGKTPA